MTFCKTAPREARAKYQLEMKIEVSDGNGNRAYRLRRMKSRDLNRRLTATGWIRTEGRYVGEDWSWTNGEGRSQEKLKCAMTFRGRGGGVPGGYIEEESMEEDVSLSERYPSERFSVWEDCGSKKPRAQKKTQATRDML
jgi:hypothetical protein